MESTITTRATKQALAAASAGQLRRGQFSVPAEGCSTRGKEAKGMMESASKDSNTTDELTFPLWKRTFDTVLILLSAPIWIPVCIVISLVIRLGSKGPILFRQERVGQGGRVFVCHKFRTMHLNAEQVTHKQHVRGLIESSSPMVKLDNENDCRLIPGGSWIRATGLDELAQIINILRGEMSIVGPRPCIPYEYELYQPWQRHRCDAPPGLTGLWQVSGKNRTTFAQMVNLDITYYQRMSLGLDLWILIRTPIAIVQQVLDIRATKHTKKSGE